MRLATQHSARSAIRLGCSFLSLIEQTNRVCWGMSRQAVATLHPVTLEAVHAELTSLRELIERLLLPTSPQREWLSVEEAAALTAKSPQCIRGWCRSHRIGSLINGAWRIDRQHLRRYLVARFGEDRLPASLR